MIKEKAGNNQAQGQAVLDWACKEVEEATSLISRADQGAVAEGGGLQGGESGCCQAPGTSDAETRTAVCRSMCTCSYACVGKAHGCESVHTSEHMYVCEHMHACTYVNMCTFVCMCVLSILPMKASLGFHGSPFPLLYPPSPMRPAAPT